MPQITDKAIKLMLVFVILFATVIFCGFLIYISTQPKYVITDTHILSDLTREMFSLLIVIVVYYFGNSSDQSKINDNIQQLIQVVAKLPPPTQNTESGDITNVRRD